MKRHLIIFGIFIILLLGAAFFVMSKQKLAGQHTVNQSETVTGETVIQSHRSYSVQLTSEGNLQPDRESVIRYKIVDEQGNTQKNFELDHEKLMHLLIVRTDLQNFQHLHPELNKDSGEFSVPVIIPDNGTYRLFADFIPEGTQMGPDGQHLAVTTSTDITVGDINQTRLLSVNPDTQNTKTVGDYDLTYTLPDAVETGKPVSIVINVSKNGAPVKNMEAFLGAQAHGILLKKDTLDFAHLHAMGDAVMHEMNGEMMTHGDLPKGPEITFDYTFPQNGVYKLFTQFQHEGKVITSDYTFSVK